MSAISDIGRQVKEGYPQLRRRLGCYASGDFEGAAAVTSQLVDAEGEIPWQNDGEEDVVAVYALDAALRSFSQAESATAGLQQKASSLVGITLAASAASLAATNAALRVAHNPGWLQWLSFALWCLVDLVLVVAALYAFLGTSVRYGSGLNLYRLERRGSMRNGYKRHEALVWHKGALKAMEAATRLGNDIFTSRRWLLSGLGFALLATIVTVTRTT